MPAIPENTDVPPDGDQAASSQTPAAPCPLPEAAQRALAEAEARRRISPPLALPDEIGGRDGPEAVRYGDYERKGIAVDF